MCANFEQLVRTVEKYYANNYGNLLSFDEWNTLLSRLFAVNRERRNTKYFYNDLDNVVSKLFANAQEYVDTLPRMSDYPKVAIPHADHAVVLARNDLDTELRDEKQGYKRSRGLKCFKKKKMNVVYTENNFTVGINKEVRLVRARFDETSQTRITCYAMDHLLFSNDVVLLVRHMRFPNTHTSPLQSLFVNPDATVRFGTLTRPSNKSGTSQNVSNNTSPSETRTAPGLPELVSRKRASPEPASNDSNAEETETVTDHVAKSARTPKHAVHGVSNDARAEKTNAHNNVHTKSSRIIAVSDDDSDPDYAFSESDDSDDDVGGGSVDDFDDISDDDDINGENYTDDDKDDGAALSSETCDEQRDMFLSSLKSHDSFIHVKVPRYVNGVKVWVPMMIHPILFPELAEKGVFPRQFEDCFKNVVQHQNDVRNNYVRNDLIVVQSHQCQGTATIDANMLKSMVDHGMLGRKIQRWRRK